MRSPTPYGRLDPFWVLTCDSACYEQDTLGHLEEEAVDGLVGAKGQFVVEALVAHVLAEHSGISSETRHRHPDVIVDFEHFLLVACEFGGQSLEAAEDDMIGGAEAEAD